MYKIIVESLYFETECYEEILKTTALDVWCEQVQRAYNLHIQSGYSFSVCCYQDHNMCSTLIWSWEI